MAKTPPNRSYRLFSGDVCLLCAYAFSVPVNAAPIGAALIASPATTDRLEIERETLCAVVISLTSRLRCKLGLIGQLQILIEQEFRRAARTKGSSSDRAVQHC